jgi:hypothetical protein
VRERLALAGAVVLVTGALLYALARGLDAERIADELPVFPGARLEHRSTNEHSDRTTVELSYALRRGATGAAVLSFYARRMDASWSRPGQDCAGFTRDGALVIAGIDIFDRTVLRVLVDGCGAESCEQYESVLST